jgi:hypothetical protein
VEYSIEDAVAGEATGVVEGAPASASVAESRIVVVVASETAAEVAQDTAIGVAVVGTPGLLLLELFEGEVLRSRQWGKARVGR